MDILSIISMACTFGLWYISNERKKKIEELEKEIERLKREISVKQKFDDLCEDIENHLTDTRQ